MDGGRGARRTPCPAREGPATGGAPSVPCISRPVGVGLDEDGGPFVVKGRATFDAIVAADVLYQGAAAEVLPWVLRARLKPGGRALIVARNSRTGDTVLPLFEDTCAKVGGLRLSVEADIALSAAPTGALHDAFHSDGYDAEAAVRRYLGEFVALRVEREDDL